MRKINKIVDFVARGLEPSKQWTDTSPIFSELSYYTPRSKKSTSKSESEISHHNQAYQIPGRDYLKETKV